VLPSRPGFLNKGLDSRLDPIGPKLLFARVAEGNKLFLNGSLLLF